MLIDVDAVDLVKQFSHKQQKLVKKLLSEKSPSDLAFFKDLEAGSLEVDGESWTYRRHGAGITFRSGQTKVINAHVGMAEIPGGLDAWRLLLYMESLGLQSVCFRGKLYSVGAAWEDLSVVESLLVDMAAGGVLRAESTKQSPVRRLYVLAEKAEALR